MDHVKVTLKVEHRGYNSWLKHSQILVSVLEFTATFCIRNIEMVVCEYNRDVEFEILTAVVMKSSIFWDITPCSPLKVNRHFGRTCRIYFKGRRISQPIMLPVSAHTRANHINILVYLNVILKIYIL
jgi:hypothetical protein